MAHILNVELTSFAQLSYPFLFHIDVIYDLIKIFSGFNTLYSLRYCPFFQCYTV